MLHDGVLTCVSWNLRGCKSGSYLRLIDEMRDDTDFDLALLQETTDLKCSERYTPGGCRVLCWPTVPGRKAVCIVLSSNISNLLLEKTMHGSGRAMSVRIKLDQLGAFQLISAQLDSSNSRGLYLQSLNDTRTIVDPSIPLMIGIDAQCVVATREPDEDFNVLGDFSEAFHARDWKSRIWLDFCHEFGVSLCNTFCPQKYGTWTCHCDNRTEPRQIDYFGITASSFLHRLLDSTTDSPTTKESDHRAIISKLRWGDKVHVPVVRKHAKPIGWRLTTSSDEFSSRVLRALGRSPECLQRVPAPYVSY